MTKVVVSQQQVSAFQEKGSVTRKKKSISFLGGERVQKMKTFIESMFLWINLPCVIYFWQNCSSIESGFSAEVEQRPDRMLISYRGSGVPHS